MTVEALLNQSVTLRRISGETRDSAGEPTLTYTESTTTMFLEPTRGRENEDTRNTGAGEWLGIGRADVEFSHWDQIVYGARTFDIVSPVRPYRNPRSRVFNHQEMDLREVT